MDLFFVFMFLISGVINALASIDDIKIYPATDMPEPMRRHALGEALIYIENETNVDIIAKHLTKEMNSKFGQPFICFVGQENIDTAINIEPQPKTFLSFSYENIFFNIFKANFESKPIDVINEARNANITTEKKEMNSEMEKIAIDIFKLAIKAHNDFSSIAKNISATFDVKYGFFWHCFVSEKGINTFNTNHVNGTFISITIAQLKITLFKTHGQESLVDLTTMIDKALSEKPVIIQRKGNVNDTEIIEMVKLTIREELKTCKNCYQVITSKLIASLNQKYNGHWEVAIGIQDSCDAAFYRDQAAYYLDFTLGKLLTRISQY